MAKSSNPDRKKLILLLLTGIIVLITVTIFPKIQVYIQKPQANALISFPKDHVFHPGFLSEWWYLNLLARTTKTDGTDQKDLGYLISFSKIANNNGLLTSRYDQSTKSFREKTNTGGSLIAYLINNKYMFVQYSNGSNYATLEEKPTGTDRKRVYVLDVKTAEIGNISLTLKERSVPNKGFTTPLLWGGTTGNCQGKISVFSENDTYYYSIPDLDIVAGKITDVDGIERKVKIGKTWMDHQWFNSRPSTDWKGHYWSGLHLTKSSNLYNPGPHYAIGFVTQIYSTGPKYTYWVKRNTNGTNQCGMQGGITVNNYGATNYPSSWTINLKKSGNQFLKIKGSPFSNNQIITPPGGLPIFFEPASYFSGTLNETGITGLGFFETHITKPQ